MALVVARLRVGTLRPPSGPDRHAQPLGVALERGRKGHRVPICNPLRDHRIDAGVDQIVACRPARRTGVEKRFGKSVVRQQCRALVEAGVGVTGLTTRQEGLEDLFLKVAGKGGGAAERFSVDTMRQLLGERPQARPEPKPEEAA